MTNDQSTQRFVNPISMTPFPANALPDPGGDNRYSLVISDDGSLFVSDGTQYREISGSADPDPYGAGNQWQHFNVEIKNVGGTLNHFIKHPDASAPAPLVSAVANASFSLTPTPTGPDASTAFAAGVKIGNPDSFKIWLDTADIVPAQASVMVRFNSTNDGVAYLPDPEFESVDINGVTRTRLAIGIRDTSHATVGINTILPTNDRFIQVEVMGWLPPFS